jgi:hypothetical protein
MEEKEARKAQESERAFRKHVKAMGDSMRRAEMEEHILVISALGCFMLGEWEAGYRL